MAVLGRAVDPGDRAVLAQLRRLETLRVSAPAGGAEGIPCGTVPLAVITAAAAAQVVAGAGLACTSSLVNTLPPAGLVQLALAGVFSVAGLLLAPAAMRDGRAFLLLSVFVLTASAFMHPFVQWAWYTHSEVMMPLFRGFYPEVFAPAAMWGLAAVFPAVARFTAADRLARRAMCGAWVVGTVLLGANLLLVYAPDIRVLDPLGRSHTSYLYWQLHAVATLPAFLIILVRARRAPAVEQWKVRRFAGALAAGAGPFLLLGVSRSVPHFDAWMRSAAVRTWVDPLVLVPLGALPLLASIAVLVDRPFGAPARMPGPGRTPLARTGHLLARYVRQRGMRERLAVALDRLRLARGSRELRDVLAREVQSAIGAANVSVVEATSLPRGTGFLALLTESGASLDLSPDQPVFPLLCRADREWIVANGITLAAPIQLRDGTIPAVLLVASSRDAVHLNRAHTWFIGALAAAAAAAWPLRRTAAGDEPPDECCGCGLVRSPDEPPCCSDALSRTAAIPQRLADKYLVIRRLGAGGMGIVYLAHDERLGRDVALKTLPGLDRLAVQRLRSEARVMAALDHPAIARIHGFETWRDTPVLVLEYMPGGTLAGVLAHGRLPAAEAVRLGIRLADALTHMHARGVLHRDIKPANIGFAAGGEAKLLDFGLAGVDEQGAGTRGYMPPEAAAGAAPDAGADLWALATVLREAGEPDDRLDAFFARAFAHLPVDRFQSSEAMSAVLRQTLAKLQRGLPGKG